MNQPYLLQHTDLIITVASWEERFLLGMTQLVRTITPKRILMFHYKEYADWSKDNRECFSNICKDADIELTKDKELSFVNPLESWKTLFSEIEMAVSSEHIVTLDISTMPREAIWGICHELNQRRIEIQFTYHKPEEYADWLSRDPGRPRLLYKLSGVQYLGRQTALIIQTGYDTDRVKQLERLFEPDKVILALQTGDQFGNAAQNRNKHINAFSSRRDIETFDVDGYSIDSIYESFMAQIEFIVGSYNVVISSLGPKVGALALYKTKNTFPDISMCYAPSNEFNQEYSKGISDSVYGVLKF